MLDGNGNCAYITAYNRELALHPDGKNISVQDKTCLCTQMRNFKLWTCGHYTYRLKDTTRKNADGSYQLLSAEHIFNDYLYSVDHQVAVPPQSRPRRQGEQLKKKPLFRGFFVWVRIGCQRGWAVLVAPAPQA